MKLILTILFKITVQIFIVGFVSGLLKPENKRYLNQIGWQASCLLNTVCGPLFNKILITKNGYQFGQAGESVSSAIGRNELTETLTDAGAYINFTLDLFDKNHAIKNIQR